jgi:hypothetical protein
MSLFAIEQQVWDTWLARNSEEERAYAAQWHSRARTLLFATLIASVVYFFVR